MSYKVSYKTETYNGDYIRGQEDGAHSVSKGIQ